MPRDGPDAKGVISYQGKDTDMAQIFIVGTCDTKHTEIRYVQNIINSLGGKTCIVDVGVFDREFPPYNCPVVRLKEKRPDFFNGISDRGKALAEMGNLLEEFLVEHQGEMDGIIGLGGSCNTALVTRGMRRLPVGLPKVMVSTVASGDVAPYVGATDICMMPSVVDVQGLNVISRKILGNAANAVMGMADHPVNTEEDRRKILGMTMFGVTTTCVQQVCSLLDGNCEPLVFHATGTGGRCMEKLIDSGMIHGVLDITLTEVCDLMMGGIMSAGEDRIGAVIRTKVPCVFSVGALDMVNFAALPTVPEQYRNRNLYVHNDNITLMRTTVEENVRMGRWIGEKLNQCEGKVCMLLPEKGISAIDAPGMPFYSPEADQALFEALEETVHQTEKRKIIRLPYHINDKEFAEALKKNFDEISA